MGVLRRRLAIEQVLSGLVSRPLDKTDPEVREVLLTMAYQTLFLSRVPAHARVSASVDAAKKLAGGGAARFVNAVGRALERRIKDSDVLSEIDTRILCSIPDHILAMMTEAAGRPLTTRELEATTSRAPSSFRVNSNKRTRDEVINILKNKAVGARPSEWAPDGIVIESPGLQRDAGLVPGIMVPQDEASQLVVEVLAPRPGELVIDMCAGAGMKTSQILAKAPDARVVAIDRDKSRLARLKRLCDDMGLAKPEIMERDVRRLPPGLVGVADAVLVDAPCTGIGTLVRRPEVRYVRRKSDFNRATRLQAEILFSAFEALKPGGRLVYAVCSFETGEGPGVLKRVLRKLGGAVVKKPVLDLPFFREDGSMLTLPWRDGMDGFYVALVKKN